MEGDAGLRVPADDDANQRQLVDSFCGITSASRAEAIFFLDSHKWQLDSAIHSFYDTNQDQDQHVDPPQRQGLPEEVGDEDEEEDEDYLPPEVHREKAGGIRTFADLNRQASGTASDTDSDGPQEYYAGGQRSGMLVQDPSRKSHDVDSLFEQARQMGATEGPYENSRPSSNSTSFTGRGRLLSGETVEAAPQTQQPENIVHDIVFWTNGFTVDDGPLRRFDDPSNASFLESIKKSECPRELEPSDKRSSVHVNLSRKEQKYSVPVKRKSPFQGAGRTLGSCSGTEDTELPAPSNNESRSSVGLSIDDSLPSTSIQLRLADGTRMVARFNTHRTVGDIHLFINASRPGANRNYQLQTVGFPPKQLTDMDVTIDQAGLANSVVIQKCR